MMKRPFMRTLFGVISLSFAATAFGQTIDGKTAFEIADVHTSPRTLHPAPRGGFHSGRYELRMATMADLVAAAYAVTPDKVAGGPSWLDTDRFDIIAKALPETPPQTVKLMLQALLADRFGLAVHTDQRPMAAYILSAGKGKPKFKASSDSTSGGCQRVSQAAEAAMIPVNCHGLSMAAFAQQLRGMAGDYLMSPVVDDTKIEGIWDFTLQWTPRGRLATAGGEGITIFDAVDKQLGLKLKTSQVPAPVVVVDRVNRKPTENAAGVSASLPPSPPPAFEVATIKPTDPQFQGIRIQTPPNGLVSIQGVTLSFLIQTIWFMTPEMIVGAPKWFDTARWDIAGKLTVIGGATPQTDMDSMIAMVRGLLEDRFKLKTHMEERVVPAYTLVAAKPKLRKANAAGRTGCVEGPGADGKDPRFTNPALSRLATCRNMTMGRFAELLPNLANALNPLNGYIRSSVLDSTGLEGAWDFTLSFSPTPLSPEAGAGSSDPNGSVSLSEALSSQLGLRLQLERRPAPVLVIDHVEREPTDN
jgi:uncharacterized protein (TIGR03435 family)